MIVMAYEGQVSKRARKMMNSFEVSSREKGGDDGRKEDECL